MLDFEYSLQCSYKKTWKKLQAVQWRSRTFCWKPQYFEDILGKISSTLSEDGDFRLDVEGWKMGD